MAPSKGKDSDPIAEQARRARGDADRSLLPSNDGLGPGAGDTPTADVSAGHSDPEDAANSTSTPSLGGPTRRTERPDFRSSQLDGAPEEEEEPSSTA